MLLFINATRSTNVTRDYWFMLSDDPSIPREFMINGMEYSIHKALNMWNINSTLPFKPTPYSDWSYASFNQL